MPNAFGTVLIEDVNQKKCCKINQTQTNQNPTQWDFYYTDVDHSILTSVAFVLGVST